MESSVYLYTLAAFPSPSNGKEPLEWAAQPVWYDLEKIKKKSSTHAGIQTPDRQAHSIAIISILILSCHLRLGISSIAFSNDIPAATYYVFIPSPLPLISAVRHICFNFVPLTPCLIRV